jgi:hypothetical protein
LLQKSRMDDADVATVRAGGHERTGILVP